MQERVEQVEAELDALNAAVRWKMELVEADLESSLEFESWLAADENHAKAWDRVEQSWDQFDPAPDGATSFEIEKLRRQVRDSTRTPVTRWMSGVGGRSVAAAVTLAVCLFGAASIGPIWRAQTSQTYEAPSTGPRVVSLADGSTVTLDAAAVVTVRYTRGERDLQLKQGQARFQVAHDDARPFAVDVGQYSVLTTGTDFNIDRASTKIGVALIEGGVMVSRRRSVLSPRSGWAPVRLSPGREIVIDPDRNSYRVVQVANLESVTSWQEGLLIFDNEPLGSAVARINRYTDRPVVVDRSVAAVRVSGVFKTGDTAGFVEAVTGYLPVSASRNSNGGVRLAAP